jgi:hypothetical protein
MSARFIISINRRLAILKSGSPSILPSSSQSHLDDRISQLHSRIRETLLNPNPDRKPNPELNPELNPDPNNNVSRNSNATHDALIRELYPIASYYFDGRGKSIRPSIVFQVAQAISPAHQISEKSFKIGMIAEMIHTASLIHDDVIDKSDTRRGKEAANIKWGVSKSVMAGNYIISHSSRLLASLNSNYTTITISRIIDDLIRGELIQMEMAPSKV